MRYKRAPIKDDKQNSFVETCRKLGVRVIAGFIIGFPEDTEESIRAVLRYAKTINPFAANFNICTPYPGTGFLEEIEDKIGSKDWSRYDVYTANLKYENLTTAQVQHLHQKCFEQYYFRWKYLSSNWEFLLPRLHAATTWLRSQPPVTTVTAETNSRPPATKLASLPVIHAPEQGCAASPHRTSPGMADGSQTRAGADKSCGDGHGDKFAA
jgi:hypothetical protein